MEQKKTVDFESLLEENLFCEWADVLSETNNMFRDNNRATYLWERAKHYAIGVVDSKKPVLKFRNRCREIRNEFDYNPLETQYILSVNPHELVYNIVVGCVYTMIVFSAEKSVAQQIIKEIPVYDTVRYGNIGNVVNAIIEKITNNKIEHDYDYTKTNGILGEDVDDKVDEDDSECLSLLLHEKDEEIHALKNEISKLQEEVKSYQEGPMIEKPHNKVRLEVFYRLLEECGVDMDTYGVKASAARLAEYITDISFSTCSNHATHRKSELNAKEHKEEVDIVNEKLSELDLECYVEIK